MKIEEQVVSLELSKKLFDLGLCKDSIFIWGNIRDYQIKAGLKPEVFYKKCLINCFDHSIKTVQGVIESGRSLPAYTVAELGIMLPNSCGTLIDFDQGFTVYGYERLENGAAQINHYHECDTEANARAKLLIYLIENKLLKI